MKTLLTLLFFLFSLVPTLQVRAQTQTCTSNPACSPIATIVSGNMSFVVTKACTGQAVSPTPNPSSFSYSAIPNGIQIAGTFSSNGGTTTAWDGLSDDFYVTVSTTDGSVILYSAISANGATANQWCIGLGESTYGQGQGAYWKYPSDPTVCQDYSSAFAWNWTTGDVGPFSSQSVDISAQITPGYTLNTNYVPGTQWTGGASFSSINFIVTSTGPPSITNSPITINSPLPPGMENVPYKFATVSGGVSPTVKISPLPAGLTADASGNISGTPATGTAAKSPYQITISASDSAGDAPVSATLSLTITANCTTPPVPFVSPGISWTQVDPNWSSKPYDHANPPKTTIGDQGCLLTAIAYGMSAAGQPINPITLNGLFDNIPGAYSPPKPGKANSGGRISPLTSIIAAASNHALKLDTTYTGQKNVTATLDHYLCSATPQPVIVKVDNDGDTHYVVVTGKTGNNTYSIVDPGWINNPRTLLSEYDNEFSVWGVVKPPVGSDPSALSFSILDNATMLVTDPSGAVSGVDAATGSELKGSPQQAYFEISNAINNENETVAANETMYTVQSFLPSEGTYTVQVEGLQLGSYELTVQSLDVNGNPQTLTSIPGIANVGSSTSLQVTYSAAVGIAKITPTVTFATVLADVSNSLAAGLIGDRIVADILTDALKLAEWGANQNNVGGSDVERIALGVFRQVVNEQNNKQITGLAPQVLLGDASSLISQITAN